MELVGLRIGHRLELYAVPLSEDERQPPDPKRAHRRIAGQLGRHADGDLVHDLAMMRQQVAQFLARTAVASKRARTGEQRLRARYGLSAKCRW